MAALTEGRGGAGMRELLGGIIDCSRDLIAALDLELRLTALNRAYRQESQRLFGCDLAVGDSLLEALSHRPEDQENARRLWGRALSGESFSEELRFAEPGGGHRFFEAVYTPLRDTAGRVVGACHVVRDVTADRQAEAVRRKLELLDRLEQGTRELSDPVEIMAVVTREVARHLGASRCAYADVESDSDGFTIPQDYSEGVPTSAGDYRLSLFGPRAVADLRGGRTLVLRDVEGELAPGEGPEMFGELEIRAIICCPLVKEGRLVAMMAVHQTAPRDWTADEVALVETMVERSWAYIERARAQRVLQQAKDAAEEASRAKDQFLAVLSHELRTPLTPVLAAAQLLEMDRDLPARHRDSLAMIRRNVQLEARLIDDLLDLTRIARGKLELQLASVDVHEKIRLVVRMLEAEAAAKPVSVAVHLEAARPLVTGDAARIQQVLWNLIKNSVKFTPPEGGVQIRTWDSPEGRLRVEVRDTGVGIDPEVLPRIFDAFEQGGSSVTRQFGGLGLGLAISKSLVDLHGGTLTAASEGPGRGATFTLELPALIPDATTAAGAAAAAPAPPENRGARLLLVEDHLDTADAMARLLGSFGYDVRVAGTVASALEAAES
ncbi:MAG TPA: ATP-binding protein, partial [Thermoanaerobaculia bacterium]|nr:ATP-binding protein [Thermoanaerobaculia bacterium]